MFEYMEKRFDAIDAKLTTKAYKADVDRILSTLDRMESHYDTEEQERAALSAADDRHEDQLDDHEHPIGKLEDQTA